MAREQHQAAIQVPASGQPGEFERVLANLEAARSFGKIVHQSRVLAQGQKLLDSESGIALLYASAARFDAAGLFTGGDWEHPENLQPALVRGTLQGGGPNAAVEALSELRLLAIAAGEAAHTQVSSEQARAYLEQVLASNLDMLAPAASEAARAAGPLAERIQRLFAFLLDQLGAAGILAALVTEVERVLLQRPIMIQQIEALLRAARLALEEHGAGQDDDDLAAARRFIAALYGPTPLAAGKSAPEYGEALASLAAEALRAEAVVFGTSMSQTGLVAPQHAALLSYLVASAPELLPDALALDAVGRVSLEQHPLLIADIIRFAIGPETVRCIYGLSRLLGRGTLFFAPVAPGLRRLMLLPIDPQVAEALRAASEWDPPPPANVLLLAGTLSVLGQPRGVDQGHNPTCQAARAISLWAQNDVGYLLDLIAHAASENELVMHFESDTIRSGQLQFGLARELHTELDPVSLVVTPHLDRIYMEMSRRTIERPGDGHRWVNPEFHGWWVYRDFAEIIDTATGAITGADDFIRRFYAAYHPAYNGGRDLVYAQPCGIASTDHAGAFVGWHAIAIQRVARDPAGDWRIYFFNPNRDKGQSWGQGVVTSTHDQGEFEGESSLPFEQFASRLYVFHYKQTEFGDPAAVPADTVAAVRAAIAASWGAGMPWDDTRNDSGDPLAA